MADDDASRLEAVMAYCAPPRGDEQIHVEIEGPRVTVVCRGAGVRVILKRPGRADLVETHLVESVEVRVWRRNSWRRSPETLIARDGKHGAMNGRSGRGSGRKAPTVS